MADQLKSNAFSQEEKLFWLTRLDSLVKANILDTHQGCNPDIRLPYTVDTPSETELLIPPPFDQAYIWWLGAQMDYHNGEYTRYNNAIALFESSYQAFGDWYHRQHRPLGWGSAFY